jgi:hypothetical protein
MDPLGTFLRGLLHRGRVAFRSRPVPEEGPGRSLAVLEEAFAAYRLEVAGPLIAFGPGVALTAGELVRQACWALVARDERPEDLRPKLKMPLAPVTPSDHLSADLVLRFLPQVHRRARGIDPSDPLAEMLAEVLRQWPLSGVLSDLDDGPPKPPDVTDHPGLMLLYAERLARRERPAWRPSGRALEYVELVLHGLGRERSPLLVAEGESGDG